MNFLDGYIEAGKRIKNKQARHEFYGSLVDYYESEEEEITKPRPAQTVSDARGGVLYYWFSGSAADRTNYLYRSTSLVRWV